MPNDDNKIILEFPATNVEIELGETITFDNISGFLDSERVTYNGDSLTEIITHLEDDKADTTYVNEELAKKADKTDTYTKSQVDNALNNKMNKANPTGTGSIAVGSNMLNIGSNSQTFGSNTKALGNNAFATGENTQASVANQFVFGKYNQYSFGNLVEIVGNGTSESNRSNARTLDWSGNETLAGDLTFNGNKSLTSEISRLDGKIDNLPAPMIFKGTLGVNGTIQSLPTASASNEGYTYKVITDGTYAGQTAKVGDVFTSNGSAWVYIPSGDEDNDTWRAIKVNGVEKLGNGISSGAVDFEDTANVKFEFDANGNKIKAKLDGIYTESDVDELLDDKADADNTYTKAQVDDIVYGILPDDTASGGVANFTTSLELPIKSLDVDVNAVQESGTPTPATPLPISGWNKITLVNCGNKYKPNIKPFSEWERARSDYYISRFSVPNTIITVNLIDKDTTVDLSGISFGYVDSNWDTKTPLTTTKYRWFIQGGTVQTGKRNISAGDASIILTGLIFYPATEATYNKLMARYDYEFVFSETSDVEPYNTEVINLGGTYYGGHFTQDKAGHRQFEVTHNYFDIGSTTWNNAADGYTQSKVDITDMKTAPSGNTKANFVCSSYKTDAPSNVYNKVENNTIAIATSQRLRVYDTRLTGMTGQQVQDALTGIYIAYEMVTPIVIDLPDGEPIVTLIGTNNIFADTGDTSVVFKDSVNGYVEKKIARVQALALNT